jgi:esterase/lipase
MDASDHAFTRERDREAMTRHVIDWLKTPLGAK